MQLINIKNEINLLQESAQTIKTVQGHHFN